MRKISFKNLVVGGLNLAVETSVYMLTQLIISYFSLTYQVIKIDAIDNLFHFNKWWIIPYVMSYGWWVIAGAIINTTNKKDKWNYLFTMFITILIGGIVFIVYPTRIDRVAEGVFDQLTGNDLISKLCLFVFNNDGGQYGGDLFPSFHVIVSTLCALGTCKLDVSKGYKAFSIFMLILISISTLFTKQHYVLDVVSGIILPMIIYVIVNKVDLYAMIFKKK